jgi:hypothetical protein
MYDGLPGARRLSTQRADRVHGKDDAMVRPVRLEERDVAGLELRDRSLVHGREVIALACPAGSRIETIPNAIGCFEPWRGL